MVIHMLCTNQGHTLALFKKIFCLHVCLSTMCLQCPWMSEVCMLDVLDLGLHRRLCLRIEPFGKATGVLKLSVQSHPFELYVVRSSVL